MPKNDVEILIALDAKQFKNGLKSINSLYDKTAKGIKDSSKGIDKDIAKVEKGFEGANKSLKKTTQLVPGVNFSLKKIKKNAGDSGNAFKNFEAKLEKANSALKKASTNINKTTAAIKKKNIALAESARKTAASSSVFSVLAKRVAIAAAAFISIRAVFRAFVSALTTAAEFEKRMSAVAAVMGATSAEMNRMARAASHMGETTQFTAIQAAEALEFLGMAGLSASQAIAALPATLQLAAAGGLDLATAADLATNVISGMNKDVSELNRVVDVLAYTASKANTNVGQLGGALKIAGPIAASLGISLEQTASILGQFANRGVRAEDAGEKFKQMVARLVSPTKEAKDAMKKLNVELVHTADGSVDLVQTFRDFQRAGLDAAQAGEIFGKRTFVAGLIAASASRDMEDFEDSITGVGNAAEGAGKRMAEMKLRNAAGDITILLSAVEGLAKGFGDAIINTGEMRDLISDLTDTVGDLTKFVRENSDDITSFFLDPLMVVKNNIKFVADYYNQIQETRKAFADFALGTSNMSLATRDFASRLFDLTPTLDNLYQKIELVTLGTVKNWKATYKEVSKQGKAYESVAESMVLLRETQEKLQEAGLNETKIASTTLRLRELGRAFASVGGDPAKLAKAASIIQAQAEAEIKAARDVFEKKASFEVQIHNKKREIANLNIALEDLVADQTKSILSVTSDHAKRLSDAQLQKKIGNGNKELAALKNQLEQSKKTYQSYVDKVKELESQRVNVARSIEDEIREIKRKGMTEAQQQADILKQINEKISKANKLRLEGEAEASKALLGEARSLNARIGDSKKQVKNLKDIGKAFDEIAKLEISKAKEAQDAEKEKTKTIEDQIIAIQKMLDSLKGEQVIRIETNIEEVETEISKIDGYLNELTKPRTVKINVEKVEGNRLGGPIGFNSGGRLAGYGGGDKVSALLEAGEYVIRKEAVRKYGAGLFAALNGMNFKPGALSNLNNMPRLKFATGGQVPDNGSGPRVTEVIRLQVGNRFIDVASPKNTINEFLDAIEQGKRGL